MNTLQVMANNEIVIKGKVPTGLESLSTDITSHKGMPENKGSHGLSEFCYKTDSYIVYSNNLLGHGYQLSKLSPNSLKCSKSSKAIKSENKLGMHIGMSKKAVENLMGIGSLKEKQTIIWQSSQLLEGQRFDLQTHVELLFNERKLEWLSVFTTTTN